jgi:hypothetical protein
MPQPVMCTGIKLDGFQCTSNAKANGRCKTHSHDKYESAEQEDAIYKSYLLKRYRHLTLFVDFNHRLPYIRNIDIVRRDISQIQLLITASENIIRPDYPGWESTFGKHQVPMFMHHRLVSHRTEAERRCIAAGLPHNLAVMHEWFVYLHTRLAAAQIVCLVDDLYDITHFNTIIRPAIVAQIPNIPAANRTSLLACFTNLGTCGQTYIGVMAGFMRPAGPLRVGAEFVQDNQNVHRTSTVTHVTTMFAKLMEIPVPATQNTLASIILKCKLLPKAIIQLTQHYCEPVTIYEIQNAYPKALDAVWAYIEQHPEKEELYVRVRDEMTDNIGMCAQGNLSRICNILSGYLDGIQPVVSQGEMVQNRIAAIAGDDEENKIERAKAVLQELHVPADQWAPWIEALA